MSDSYLGSEKVAVKSQNTAKSSTATQTPAQEAASEAPAEAPADPYAGKTWQEKVEYNAAMGLPTSTGLTAEEDAAYLASLQLTPDNWVCSWCNVDCISYDGYVEHMKTVHNMQ